MKMLTAPGSHVLAYSLEGKVDDKDIDVLTREMEVMLDQQESINMFMDLSELSGITPRGLLKDLLYSVRSAGKLYRFQKIAVVVDNSALDKLIQLEDRILTNVEIRSFPSAERNAALSWVESRIEMPEPGIKVVSGDSTEYLELEVGESISGFDVRRLAKLLRVRYETSGPIDILARCSKRPGYGPGYFYEKAHCWDLVGLLSKVAVCGPETLKTPVHAVSAVINPRLRYFPQDSEAQARAWLCDLSEAVDLLPSESPHLIALRVDGKLTSEQIKNLYRILTAQLRGENEVDVLLELPYREGMSLSGVFEALRLGLKHFGDVTKGVRRLALVTDSRWLSKALDIENVLLTNIEERPFTFAQRHLARAWLLEGRE